MTPDVRDALAAQMEEHMLDQAALPRESDLDDDYFDRADEMAEKLPFGVSHA